MFEVSPSTIYRDVDTINMAGIPVRSTSGVGGGFEIMEQYKVDKKVFSTADLSALLMGLSSISGMVRGDELVHTLAKVKSNMQPYIEIIKTALQECRLLTFEYIAHHGNQTARTVEPYQLVLKIRIHKSVMNWFLIFVLIKIYCKMKMSITLSAFRL